ncbi:MAG: cobalt-precorrin 5A hydrolase [Eubacteriales bacterium]|nr:cobalt-precorrin 5A hydrolase [Eubacteriales bacterium]
MSPGKTAILCFSLTGYQTGQRLKKGMEALGCEVSLDSKSKYLPDSVEMSHQAWTEKQFQEADAIVFIGACGIAVRSIAPFVKSKKTDPAVLVIDECGNFVISLLSGHLGGANELAHTAAGILHAQPVVTTATDLHSCFAVDVFARQNGCGIFHMKAAKEVSAALLAGERVGFYSPYPFEGALPNGLVPCDSKGKCLPENGVSGVSQPKIGIAVTIYKEELPFPSTVQVVPKTVVLGMGCKKGREADAVYEAAENCIKNAGIYREAVSSIASVDLKKDEPGMLSLSEIWKIPFVTFTGEELAAVPGEFTPSSFVRQVTGVDNICERSAVLASGQGRLIQKKTSGCGVTTALAVRDWRIRFE